MKSISVIIPNYNGVDLLKRNLPSVYSALLSSRIKEFEIIIADDASNDNSIPFLKKNYPEIILIQNKINKGFAGNANSGIKIAKKDLIFILNSDVQLTDNYFIPLLRYFEMYDTFGVMSRIISMKGNNIQDGAKYPQYSFGKINSTKNYIVEQKKLIYSFFMSGANSLIDRQKLLIFNGFNELFNPYYYEDIDLGLSAWRAGYKIYYEHNSICRHINSATIKKQPSDKVKIIIKRNKIILHYLHLNGIELWFFLFITSLKSFFKLLLFKTQYLKAFILFLKSINKSSKFKKQFKTYRKKSVAEISNFIKGDIKNFKIDFF